MFKIKMMPTGLAMAAALGAMLHLAPAQAEMSAPGVGMIAAAGNGPLRQLRDALRGDQGTAAAPKTQAAGGGYTKVSLSFGGMTRDYYYYVPSSGGANKPLVVAFHGGGGKALEFGQRMDFASMAEKYGYVIVLPQGTGRNAKGGTWNAESVTGLDYAEKSNIDDVGFVKAVLDRMKSVTPYNPAKVYVAGLSKGGMMAYHFACEADERVAAIAAVASTYSSRSCSGGDVSLLHIHGTKDENVPWEGGAGDLSRKGANWPDVPRGISEFSGKNSCSTSVTSTRVTSDTVCEVRSCAGGDVIEVCKVEGGGHAWPGASPAGWQQKHGVYVSQKFDATDYIGAFFAKH